MTGTRHFSVTATAFTGTCVYALCFPSLAPFLQELYGEGSSRGCHRFLGLAVAKGFGDGLVGEEAAEGVPGRDFVRSFTFDILREHQLGELMRMSTHRFHLGDRGVHVLVLGAERPRVIAGDHDHHNPVAAGRTAPTDFA